MNRKSTRQHSGKHKANLEEQTAGPVGDKANSDKYKARMNDTKPIWKSIWPDWEERRLIQKHMADTTLYKVKPKRKKGDWDGERGTLMLP